MNFKSKYGLLLIVVAISIIQTLNPLCLKGQEFRNGLFITQFNTDLMATKYLHDFKFVRKRAIWNYGREFVFENREAKESVFITVGLHSTFEEAGNIADSYLNELSVRMSMNIDDQISLGDKYWVLKSYSDSSAYTNIVFIRKNALFILSCSSSFKGLFYLAKNIDKGITEGDSFVTLNPQLSTPVIKTLTFEKDLVKTNNSAKIRIKGSDSKNESLEYQFYPGLTREKLGLESIYTYEPSPNLKDKAGIQVIKAVAINESNVVSAIAELKLDNFK